MKQKYIPCEDICPYDQSVRWEIHNNYFQQKGGDAWKGDIPYYTASNEAAAMQNARIVFRALQLMEQEGSLDPDEQINVLEIASGLGLFAINFIQALRQLDGEELRYSDRLHFLFTDYAEKNLGDAAQNPYLQSLRNEGILDFYVVDAMNPQTMRRLGDTQEQQTPKCCAVIANYLHCVLPLSVIKKTNGRWYEKFVQTSLPIPEDVTDTERYLKEMIAHPTDEQIINHLREKVFWGEIEENFFHDILHRDVIQELTDSFSTATVIYPHGSLTSIDHTLPFMPDGGVIIISDKGYENANRMQGEFECTPSIHGNSFAHSFNFPVAEHYALKRECCAVRTNNPNYSIQTLLIEKRKEAKLDTLFRDIYITRNSNVDASDFYHAGSLYRDQKQHVLAARFYQRALQICPHDVRTLYYLGLMYFQLDMPEEALAAFQNGKNNDYFSEYDFDFEEGRALHALGKYEDALEAYSNANIQEEHYVNHNNIGLCLKLLGDIDGATEHFKRALFLNPHYERAKKELEELRT